MESGNLPRYRCTTCGNLTRFDVHETVTTRSFYHFSVGGELDIEESEVLDRTVSAVTCRWCGPSGHVEAIEDLAQEGSAS